MDKRPIDLQIRSIRLPLSAYVSILHRISGILLLPAVGVLLWLLELSLRSATSFEKVQQTLAAAPLKILLWLILVMLLYHLGAGVRHLLMDLGVGESLKGGQRGAQIVLVLAVFLALASGWWLW